MELDWTIGWSLMLVEKWDKIEYLKTYHSNAPFNRAQNQKSLSLDQTTSHCFCGNLKKVKNLWREWQVKYYCLCMRKIVKYNVFFASRAKQKTLPIFKATNFAVKIDVCNIPIFGPCLTQFWRGNKPSLKINNFRIFTIRRTIKDVIWWFGISI